MEINEITPSKSDVLNINRSRLKAVYYRQIGGKWEPTLPLPADPQSIAYYFAKGFKPQPPPENEVTEEPVKDGILRCPICEMEVKSAFGLQSHLRVHIKTEKEKNVE